MRNLFTVHSTKDSYLEGVSRFYKFIKTIIQKTQLKNGQEAQLGRYRPISLEWIKLKRLVLPGDPMFTRVWNKLEVSNILHVGRFTRTYPSTMLQQLYSMVHTQ